MRDWSDRGILGRPCFPGGTLFRFPTAVGPQVPNLAKNCPLYVAWAILGIAALNRVAAERTRVRIPRDELELNDAAPRAHLLLPASGAFFGGSALCFSTVN